MILLFHGVESQPTSKRHMSKAKFESVLKFLKNNFEIVPVKDATENTISLTFDDGYENNLTAALPLLRKYNIPATIFVLASPLENPWWTIPGEDDLLLSKDELSELAADPLIEIGCHGYFHDYLIHSIIEAKEVIEKTIGVEVRSYSFPYGQHTANQVYDLTSYGFDRIYGVQNCLPGVHERICISNNCLTWITKAKIKSESIFSGSHKYFDFSLRGLLK